jgi:hypothetical protein
VIPLSPCLFLDSSLHFLVLLECLLVVKYLIEFLLGHVSTFFLSYCWGPIIIGESILRLLIWRLSR